MLFKLSNLNSNLALTLGYLNPALNNSAQVSTFGAKSKIFWENCPLRRTMAREEKAHTPWASLFSVAFDPYSGYVEDEKRAEELIKVYEIATTTRWYLKRQGDFPTMVSILYKCPHFYFPRVYSLRITFVDHRYSLIQARKERLKSQKITKFNGLTRRNDGRLHSEVWWYSISNCWCKDPGMPKWTRPKQGTKTKRS